MQSADTKTAATPSMTATVGSRHVDIKPSTIGTAVAGSGAVALAFALLALPNAASATPLRELGGTQPAAEAWTGNVNSRTSGAAYANPAILPLLGGRWDAGVWGLVPALTLKRNSRPSGFDVPAEVYTARTVTEGGTSRPELRPLSTADVATAASIDEDPRAYATLGGVIPIVDGVLALGVTAILPVGALQSQRPFYVDEREQYFDNRLDFELLGDRLDSYGLTLGVGWKPAKAIAFGAGVGVENRAITKARVFAPDPLSLDTALTRADVEVSTSVSPHFGLLVRPLGNESLSFGVTAHLESAHEVDGSTRLRFWNFESPEGADSMELPLKQTYGYLPLRAAVAAAWKPTETVELALAGRYLRWSSYRTRMGELAGWNDTGEASASTRVALGSHEIGASALWAPSPVPPQEGRTNYVNSDRYGLHLGWGYDFEAGSWGRVSLDLDAMVQRLVARDRNKSANASRAVIDEFPDSVDAQTGDSILSSAGLQTNNPGFPGFASEGWLVGGGLFIGVER